MSTATEPRAWDRLPDEPPAAYSRFLLFLSMGPGRTLADAYRAQCARRAKVPKGVKRCRCPGSWQRESVRFRWAERATAWDVEQLCEAGTRAVVRYVNLVDELSLQLLRAVSKSDGPRKWREILESLQVLAAIIPWSAVEALLAEGKDLERRHALTGRG